MRKILLFTCIFLAIFTFAQKDISGIVKDAETGEPLPGVSVAVKGTSVGAVTGVDGKFAFKLPNDAKILAFSFIGYTTQDIKVAEKIEFNVMLQSDTKNIEEVVVTAMGIKRDKKALGYAATTVNGDDLTKVKDNSAVTSLQGKVAGVVINNSSSDPGASNTVFIRGVTSISGNNQPLFVIDGVPMMNNSKNDDQRQLDGYTDFGNGSNAINPEDIESLTVLKGAAATALYGSRASAGVILITTKSGGKSEGLGITFTSTYTVSQVFREPTFQNTYGQGWDGHCKLDENGSWGAAFDGKERKWGFVVDNSQKLKPYKALKSNYKDFFDYGFSAQNSISYSGAKDNTDFYLSYSNSTNDGIYPTDADSYDRNTFSLRASQKQNKFKLSASLNYTNESNKFVPTGQGESVINSLAQVGRDISIVDLKDYKNKFNNADNFYTIYAGNPYYSLNENKVSANKDFVFGKFELNWDIIKGLNFIYRLGGDVSNMQSNRFIAIKKAKVGSPNESSTSNEHGNVEDKAELTYQYNQDIILNYTKDMNYFKINGLLGYNFNQRGEDNTKMYIADLDIPGYNNIKNSSSTPQNTHQIVKRRLHGVYGQAELSFKDFIFLNMTARNDWSSTLPKDNNSYFYPGVSLSTIYSEILPSEIKKYINYGKVRVSYAQTGNDAEPYSVYNTFRQAEIYQPFRNTKFPLGGLNAFEIYRVLPSKNLQPEISSEFEVGTELKMLDNRISIDFTYYNKRTNEQIYNIDLDGAAGYAAMTSNIGEIENTGIELLVSLVPIKLKDFQWEFSLNYSNNKNKIIDLNGDLLKKISLGGTTSISLIAEKGGPIGSIEGTTVKTHDGKIVVDETGMPKEATEKANLGSVYNDYVMGITNTLSYKGISLSWNFDFRMGGVMYSRTAEIMNFTGNALNTTYNNREPFVIPNSVKEIVTNAGYSVYMENTTPITKDKMDDYWDKGGIQKDNLSVFDRSYVKLRSISLSYDLPKKLINQFKLTNCQFSLIAKNIWMWTPEDNQFIDPECTTFGNDLESQYGEFSANPSTSSVGASLKIRF